MSFANLPKHDTSFSNRRRVSGLATVGDLPTSQFADTTFDDVVPGTDGKTLADLTFEDVIRIDIFTDRPKSSSAFANRTKHT